MLGFIVGLIIGIIGGSTAMVLCCTAANSDRKMEEIMKNIKIKNITYERMVSLEEIKINKHDFLNYIIDYAIHTGWEDCHGKDQIRALFTSWCLIFRIDADTKECDEALSVIYWRTTLEELVEYKDYERFMVEFIV